MNYSDKLRDPRWQKRRLEILERDGWACQVCGDKEHTLHVHHKVYEQGKDPWDYDGESLVTLCDFCHLCKRPEIAELEWMITTDFKNANTNCNVIYNEYQSVGEQGGRWKYIFMLMMSNTINTDMNRAIRMREWMDQWLGYFKDLPDLLLANLDPDKEK
jgi:hypothetical protein